MNHKYTISSPEAADFEVFFTLSQTSEFIVVSLRNNLFSSYITDLEQVLSMCKDGKILDENGICLNSIDR